MGSAQGVRVSNESWSIFLGEVDTTNSPNKNCIYRTQVVKKNTTEFSALIYAGVRPPDFIDPADDKIYSSIQGGWFVNGSGDWEEPAASGRVNFPTYFIVVTGDETGGSILHTRDSRDFLLQVDSISGGTAKFAYHTAVGGTHYSMILAKDGNSMEGLAGLNAQQQWVKYNIASGVMNFQTSSHDQTLISNQSFQPQLYDRNDNYIGDQAPDITVLYYHTEHKPTVPCWNDGAKAAGIELTSWSGSGDDIIGATISIAAGIVSGNVVSGASALDTFSTGSTTGSGWIADFNAPVEYDDVNGLEILLTRPGEFRIVLSVSGAPNLITQGVNEFDHTITVNSSGRYSYLYINGAKHTLDAVSYVRRSGNTVVWLEPHNVRVCPNGTSFFLGGAVRSIPITRDSSNNPVIDLADLSTGFGNYVAYYEMVSGNPVLRFVRAGDVGFKIRDVSNAIAYLEVDYMIHHPTGVAFEKDVDAKYDDTANLNLNKAPYSDPLAYTMDDLYFGSVPATPVNKTPFDLENNWTLIDFDEDGESYENPNTSYELGIATYYLPLGNEFSTSDTQWGVVPGGDQLQLESIDSWAQDYPIYGDTLTTDPTHGSDDVFTRPIYTEPAAYGTPYITTGTTLTWPSGIAAGDTAILIRIGPVGTATPSGWDSLGFGTGSSVRGRYYKRLMTGFETGSFTVPMPSGEETSNVVHILFIVSNYDSIALTFGTYELCFTHHLVVYYTTDGSTSGTWTKPALANVIGEGASAAAGTGTAFDYLVFWREFRSSPGASDTTATHSITSSLAKTTFWVYPKETNTPDLDIDATGTMTIV